MVAGGSGGERGGMDWELGVSRCKLVYTGWINNKILLYSTMDCLQYPGIRRNGKEYEKGCLHVLYNNHFAVPEKLIQHCKSTIFQ